MTTTLSPTLDADRAALEEIRDLGLAMARLVATRAQADAAANVDTDHTPAFERAARGVRRAVRLLQFIAQTEAAAARTARDRVGGRRQIIRDVEDAATHRSPADQAVIDAELLERLDSPDFDNDLAHIPLAQLSRTVRRDIGLGEIFSHRRRTPADVRALAARAEHSAHAAALPDDPDQALAAVLRHEARLRDQR